jgi:hypothetical protein
MASNFLYLIHHHVCLSPTWIYHWQLIAGDSIGMLHGRSEFCLVFKLFKFRGRWKSKHLWPSQHGGEWSPSHPGHFTPGARAIGSYWIGGWVDPDNLPDTWGKKGFKKTWLQNAIRLYFVIRIWLLVFCNVQFYHLLWVKPKLIRWL